MIIFVLNKYLIHFDMRLYTRTSKKAGTTKLYIKPKFGKTPTWLNTGLDVSLTDWERLFL